jgi:hypothetical protein
MAGYALSQEEEFFRASALVVLGLVSLGKGDAAAALGQLQGALDNASLIGDRHTAATIWRHLARAQSALGQPHEARAALQTALNLFGEMNLPHEVSQVQAQLAALDHRPSSPASAP